MMSDPDVGMPARFTGPCGGCDAPIEVGQTIVKLRFGGWAHIDHREAAERNIGKPALVPAKFEDTCLGCGDPIEVGQKIGKVLLRGWAHAEHYDAAMRTYYPTPASPSPELRTAVGYAVQCPKCGAEVDMPCLTAAGKKGPVHASRRDLAMELDQG